MHPERQNNIATIEQGVPKPKRTQATSLGRPISITETMRALKAGSFFTIDQIEKVNQCHSVAHRMGIKIKTEKVPLVGLRIYRTE